MASKRALFRRVIAAASAPSPTETAAAPSLHRRILRGCGRRCLHQSGGISAERIAIPIGDGLIERLRTMVGRRDARDPPSRPEKPQPPDRRMEVEEAKGRLEGMRDASVSYEVLVEKCGGEMRIAKALEQRGDVLVIGNVAFLRPEQAAQAIRSMIPSLLLDSAQTTVADDDPRWAELKALEKAQASIDARASAGVRRELWGGLAYLVAQTALFMRLTFWELSWDVMEPICFYVTSFYFMIGYGFFLRTSKEPSFVGFFETRLEARRRRLMKAEGLDHLRLLELRRKLGVCGASMGKGFCRYHPRDCGDLRSSRREPCVCHGSGFAASA